MVVRLPQLTLQDELKEVSMKKFKSMKKIQELNGLIERADEEISRKMMDIERDIDSSKNDSFKIHLAKQLSPVEDTIRKLQSSLVSLGKEGQAKLGELSEERIYEELKSSEADISGMAENAEKVKNLIIGDLGERFYNEYVVEFSSENTGILTYDEMNEILARIEKTTAKLSRIPTDITPSSVDNVFEWMNSFVRQHMDVDIGNEKEETKESKNTVKISVGAGVALLAVAASFVVLPAYVGVLSFKAVKNVKRGVVLSSVAKDFSLLEGNLESMENILREQATSELNRIKEEILEDISASKTLMESQLAKAKQELENTRLGARGSFKFDEESVRARLQVPIESIRGSRERDIEELSREKETHELLAQEVESIRQKIKDASSSLLKKYIDFSKMGEARLYDPEFLIDFDAKDKPILFKMENSAIFFYKDIEEVKDFIRLICAQLRTRLSPAFLSMQVWDLENMGVYVGQYTREVPELFSISRTAEAVKEKLGDLSEQLTRKLDLITKDFPEGIGAYNKEMIELESVPEGYTFIFTVSPANDLVLDTAFLQLASQGPLVGIFPIIFMRQEDLKEDHSSLVKNIGKFHVLERTNILTKSQDNVLENLKQFGH